MNTFTTSEPAFTGSNMAITLDLRPRAFHMIDLPGGTTSRALADFGGTYATCGDRVAANRSTFSTRDGPSWRAGSS